MAALVSAVATTMWIAYSNACLSLFGVDTVVSATFVGIQVLIR
jgi:hypothetical protein